MEGKTIAPIEVKMGFKWQGLLLSVIVGMAIWLIPIPEGLSAKAWGMVALFVATIVAIIAKAMPMGAATLVALVISGLTGLTPLSPAKGEVGMLSGFSNGTIWLIAIAMFLSRAVIKTGLGKRIALYFVARFGKKMMGVAYGIALADVVIGRGFRLPLRVVAVSCTQSCNPLRMPMIPNRVQPPDVPVHFLPSPYHKSTQSCVPCSSPQWQVTR